MTANSAIKSSFDQILEAAALGYAISWPGPTGTDAAGNAVNPFETPTGAGAVWLEVTFMPNRGVDDRLANDGYVSPQGMYQVTVVGRPQPEIRLRVVAEQVQAAFPKGTRISGNIRVGSHPYTTSVLIEADRMRLPVTIEYSE
ncbi:DUF4128 domain-containing protein [Marinobacter alexandrii]|uniref:phage tail terminator-like protein n=1 Tax=Marinobacter alexandrii TaxID=2570351 RepID=UPI001FFE73B7|nr:phage tail terminator-like protein [Marinobacter alexandrii]MCK2149534.1 DUF4128 domain-containing protein [Marinobacter alexandrii]